MKVSNCCDYNIGNKPLVHIGICPECNQMCTYREVSEKDFKEYKLNTMSKNKTPVTKIYEMVLHYQSITTPYALTALSRLCQSELENEKNAIKMAYDEGHYDGGTTDRIFLDEEDYFSKNYEDLTINPD